MLINMHNDLKCNMGTLVEKLSTNVPIVEGNILLNESLQKSEMQDLIPSALIVVVEHVGT